METVLLTCPKCNSPLETAMFNQPEPVSCSGCGSSLEAIVYPAFFRPKPAVTVGELVQDEGEASCFFHPQKRAVLACDSCGRFICALCEIEHKGQHLCSDCLEKGVRKKKLADLDSRRFLYDTLALQLALWPLILPFLWFITVITAPAALYVAIRYRNAPLSLLRRSRWRLYVAGVLALVQTGIWVFLIANLVIDITYVPMVSGE